MTQDDSAGSGSRAGGQSGQSGRWYLRAGLLIDGSGGQPLQDGVVAVEGNKIVAVGPAAQFGTLLGHAGTQVVTAPVAMPGLIDCHSHATRPADSRSPDEQLSVPDEMLALTAVHQLTRHLKSGVTTVRDCNARGQVMFWVREAIRRGFFPGPRLQVAGRAVTHSRGHGHWAGGAADTLDEIRKQIRILVAEGADFIKMMASGGGSGGIPYLPAYTTEEVRAGVEAAHALERRTLAHARATQAIENCVDAGIDVIAHLEFLSPGELVDMGGAGAPTGLPKIDERVAEKVARSSAYLDLNPQSSGWDTLLVLRRKKSDQGLSTAEQAQLVALDAYFDHFIPVMNYLYRLGLVDRMGFGSDAGPYDTEFGHLEYNVYIARLSGLSPIESLQTVTRNAARLAGLDSIVGTIESGKEADLLLLDADPLADVENLTRVAAVYKGGIQVA
jgi:imidazolonepropionase-like amidohydrolase